MTKSSLRRRHSLRNRMWIPGNAERALPDAWRQKHGATHGGRARAVPENQLASRVLFGSGHGRAAPGDAGIASIKALFVDGPGFRVDALAPGFNVINKGPTATETIFGCIECGEVAGCIECGEVAG